MIDENVRKAMEELGLQDRDISSLTEEEAVSLASRLVAYCRSAVSEMNLGVARLEGSYTRLQDKVEELEDRQLLYISDDGRSH